MKIGSWVIIVRKKKVTAQQILHDEVEKVILTNDDLRAMIAKCARSVAKDKFQDMYEAERQATRDKEIALREAIESENLADLSQTEGWYPWEKRLVHAMILSRDFWDEMVHKWTDAEKENLDAIIKERFGEQQGTQDPAVRGEGNSESEGVE